VREKDFAAATVTATMLARDFPGNRDLRTFLDTHAPTVHAASDSQVP
jgi:hypothetical protein